jgi:type I restriction enzyme M protein
MFLAAFSLGKWPFKVGVAIMFEQTFKNIDDILHKDAGCTSELDYTEQSSWLLFLKYLDALEADKALEAQLVGKPYSFIIDAPYRWETWAAPKNTEGKLDHNSAITGDDLRDFVNAKLFPYLAGFKQRASGPNTIEYKIGEVFGEIKNRLQSGYSLRDVIDLVDELRFRSQTEKHELSHLYEAKIKNMGNAGRNGGEYYTPRPLIRAMIQVVAPKVGERIYDGACGSAGFLCEAFDYLQNQPGLSTSDQATLQTRSFYGKEKKSLAYVIAIMNMILHGIEAPNIVHTNTLAENIADIQERDRFDVILANPPFGGKERKEVQQNFPIKTGETAFLFLQHFIKSLKAADPPSAIFASYLIRVQLAAKELMPEFLFLFFQTQSYWDSIKAGSTGSAQGGFNASKLGNLVIPFPIALAQQREVVSELAGFSKHVRLLESVYMRKLAALAELKKSLLQQAFRGQL